MNDKQYMIDGEPVNADELIQKAKDLGYDGDAYGVLYTSGSASVLRKHGHTVKENPDYKKEEI